MKSNTPIIWKTPHIIKIYEALGALADNRVECIDDINARVYSSSRNKYYQVSIDLDQKQVISNDNSSYYENTLGYPVIAVLFMKKYFLYHKKYADLLQDIAWKDINQKYNNNFDQTKQEIDACIQRKGIDFEQFQSYINGILQIIKNNPFSHLGEKTIPPKGY